jgi:CrcB protein
MNLFHAMMLVGAGGFLGSIFRFLIYNLTQRFWGDSFPWGTFIVNIVGCFIIGVLFGLWSKGNLNVVNNRLWITGFCGGFTTFSAFSQDSLYLLHQEQFTAFLLYVMGSVVIGLLATFIGMSLTRTVF